MPLCPPEHRSEEPLSTTALKRADDGATVPGVLGGDSKPTAIDGRWLDDLLFLRWKLPTQACMRMFGRCVANGTGGTANSEFRSTRIGCNNEVGGIVFMVRGALRPTDSNDLLTQLRRDSFQRRNADTSGGVPDATLAQGDAQSSHGLLKSEALRASETNRVRLSKHGPDAVGRKER